jgi:hypothetical protein
MAAALLRRERHRGGDRTGRGTLRALARREQFREILVPRGNPPQAGGHRRRRARYRCVHQHTIAKHHAASRLTLAMKNLMGINWTG